MFVFKHNIDIQSCNTLIEQTKPLKTNVYAAFTDYFVTHNTEKR